MDILYLKDNNIVCAAPKKQSLIFIDCDKMVQKYEIKDIKFLYRGNILESSINKKYSSQEIAQILMVELKIMK